jgi:hypothetical protein
MGNRPVARTPREFDVHVPNVSFVEAHTFGTAPAHSQDDETGGYARLKPPSQTGIMPTLPA